MEQQSTEARGLGCLSSSLRGHSLRSSLPTTAALFVSQRRKINTTSTRLHYNHQFIQSLPLAIPYGASSPDSDFQRYLRTSTPLEIPRFSLEEAENYFKTTGTFLGPPIHLGPLDYFRAQSGTSFVDGYIDPSDGREYHLAIPRSTMPAPRLVHYNEATGTDEGVETEHTWLCDDRQNVIRVKEVMPCIPLAYEAEESEGRALYVIGVPPSFATQAFANLFQKCGRVDKCPCIIDLNSEETFRWVIMETADQANIVIEARNGLSLTYKGIEHTVWICKALPPGANFKLGGDWTMNRFFNGDIPFGTYTTTETLVHGHPERHTHPNPSQLAPIPRILPTPSITISTEHPRSAAAGNASITIETPPFAQTTAAVQATSWANIAGNNGALKTIDLRPEHKPSAPRLHPVGRLPSVKHSRTIEPLTDQARVIFLLELPHTMTLRGISDAIKEGPIHTIRFGTNEDTKERYAGIIFQYARDAETFYQVLQKERVDSTPARFRFIVEVRRGEEPFPADDVIRMMGPPNFATRRLTIVKSRFFFVFKEPQLRALCEKETGEGSIQIIWLYNGGNATVVFAKVEDAIAVKKRLDSLRDAADPSSHFAGLQTTFSKDPCVQEIHYISDLHD